MNLDLIMKTCQKRKIPIPKLAEKIGMSEQNLRVNIKKNKMDAEMLYKTAAALELPLLLFFGEEVDENESVSMKKKDCNVLITNQENEITMLKKMIEDKDLIISLFKEKDAHADGNAICAGARTA